MGLGGSGMSPSLLILVGVIYLGIAAQYVHAGRPWMGLVFLGYSIAQVGFTLEGR